MLTNTTSLCFVHGLTGNRVSTWTHPNSHFWPKDSLAAEFPRARIVTYGYDADVVRLWGKTSTNRIRQYGENFAVELANLRVKNSERPVIFLAHSLGGLVVEQALLCCLESSERRVSILPQHTTGIIFFGTPHQGSFLAKWGSALIHLFHKLGRNVNQDIVSVLQTKSEVLNNVETGFQRHLQNDWKHIKICCFYEELPIHGANFVVPKESAILQAYTCIGIHDDHINMVKFENAQDRGFGLVTGHLFDWISLPQPPPASSASSASTYRSDDNHRENGSYNTIIHGGVEGVSIAGLPTFTNSTFNYNKGSPP